MLQGKCHVSRIQTWLLCKSIYQQYMSRFAERLHKSKKKIEKIITPCIVNLAHV